MRQPGATPTVGQLGERLDLSIRKGATFGPVRFEMSSPDGTLTPVPTVPPVAEADYVPVNLTGCTIRGQIRRTAADASPVTSLVVTITDAAAGRYEISLAAATTATLEAGPNGFSAQSLYAWDLELEDAAGRVTPLYYGQARVWPEVTRD
jgi:hypothetical protein